MSATTIRSAGRTRVNRRINIMAALVALAAGMMTASVFGPFHGQAAQTINFAAMGICVLIGIGILGLAREHG